MLRVDARRSDSENEDEYARHEMWCLLLEDDLLARAGDIRHHRCRFAPKQLDDSALDFCARSSDGVEGNDVGPRAPFHGAELSSKDGLRVRGHGKEASHNVNCRGAAVEEFTCPFRIGDNVEAAIDKLPRRTPYGVEGFVDDLRKPEASSGGMLSTVRRDPLRSGQS